jgi:tRNA A-37 threonylcarbamoyl transferase component Bud32
LSDPHGVVREIQEQGMLRKIRLAGRRVRRSLREGSFSEEIKTDRYHAFIAREHPISLESVVLEHARNLTQREHILKFQRKTQLSAVGDLCVKSYAKPKPFTSPYALRSWKGLLTLFFNRIPVADPVAVVVGKDRASILITGLVPGRDLNRVLFHEYPAMAIGGRMELARELGRLLGTLHGLRIYHADLKASNIRVLRDPLRFVLLDTDRVSQGSGLSRQKRLRNLVQINTTIPRHVKKSVRMAFVKAYAGMTGEDPLEIFQDVWDMSRRETIAYRTDEGDRSETWE